MWLVLPVDQAKVSWKNINENSIGKDTIVCKGHLILEYATRGINRWSPWYVDFNKTWNLGCKKENWKSYYINRDFSSRFRKNFAWKAQWNWAAETCFRICKKWSCQTYNQKRGSL